MEDSWLTPEGKIIEVGKFRHNEYVIELLKKEMGEDEFYDNYEKMELPYNILHERCWIRIKMNSYEPFVQILGDCIDLDKPIRNTMNPSMNDIQMRVAKMICEENDTILHEAINDKRFW